MNGNVILLYVVHKLDKHLNSTTADPIVRCKKLATYVNLALNSALDGTTVWKVIVSECAQLGAQVKSELQAAGFKPMKMTDGIGFDRSGRYYLPIVVKETDDFKLGLAALISLRVRFPTIDKRVEMGAF